MFIRTINVVPITFYITVVGYVTTLRVCFAAEAWGEVHGDSQCQRQRRGPAGGDSRGGTGRNQRHLGQSGRPEFSRCQGVRLLPSCDPHLRASSAVYKIGTHFIKP